MDVDAKIGTWIYDYSPILGEGVFRFGGKGSASIYERGIAYANGSPAIAFADIIGYEGLALGDLSRAKRNISENVELRLRSETGEAVLTLPLVHYSSLMDLLQELARRLRLSNHA
jgi:hypothetical protein